MKHNAPKLCSMMKAPLIFLVAITSALLVSVVFIAVLGVPSLNFTAHDLTEFGESYLENPIAYCAMQVHCAIDPQIAEVFGVDSSCPMQCWRETLHDLEDRAVGRSLFYLYPDKMVMSLLTKF